MSDSYSRAGFETIGSDCLNISPEGFSEAECELVAEEPLHIIVNEKPVVTLMCTPGDEISLAIGFMYTEGVIRSVKEIGAFSHCCKESGNVVRFASPEGVDISSRISEYRAVFSSCSICGKEAVRTVTSGISPFARQKCRILPDAIAELGELMNKRQIFFRRTGGTHAAIMAKIKEGRILPESAIIKEDIGRHNALDKVVGEALRCKMSFEETLLFLSGRLSFEMVAKAARAGISDIAAVSAPTALAVELARRLNMLLVGFSRGASAVVYSGKEALSTQLSAKPSPCRK